MPMSQDQSGFCLQYETNPGSQFAMCDSLAGIIAGEDDILKI